MYVAGVVAVLSRYPVDVIEAVTDPATGLPSILQWLPSLAEVRASCDARIRPLIEAEARERRVQAQLADRHVDRSNRLTVDQLREKYGDWDHKGRNAVAARAEARARLIAQIGQAAFDALPDARPQPPIGEPQRRGS